GKTLTDPNNHTEEIFDASNCINDPTKCYTFIPHTPFGTTNIPLKMYKKTTNNKKTQTIITQIIIPPNTKIHFQDSDISNDKQKRFATGIVGAQFGFYGKIPVT